jgi:serine protease Do
MRKRCNLISLGLALAAIILSVSAIPGRSAAQVSFLTPDTFANLAQQTAGAVVNISSEREIPTGIGKIPNRRLLEQFFGPIPKALKVRSLGSGFLMDTQGFVVTNNHVVDGAKAIQVILLGHREFKATIKGRDPVSDLALIQIVDPPPDLPFLKLGDSEAMRVGDWVMAVGNPFGLGHTVTQGIISAKGRVIGAGLYDKYLQTDALINPGNSGGPLLDLKGEVIGINTMILKTAQGIGFAIPSNIAKVIIPQLREKGKVIRGMIGILMEEITPELAKKLKLSSATGTLVVGVESGGPAARAGMRPGDIIINYNGQPIQQMEELSRLVTGTTPGTVVPVTVLRKGKEMKFQLKVAELQYKGQETSPR